MKQISAPSEFMDDIAIVKRVFTNRSDLILVESIKYGSFIGLDGERDELTQIETVAKYLRGKDLAYVADKHLGAHAIRDLFSRKLKLNVPDEPTLSITAWLNIVIPAGDLIDISKVRIEAYTNQAAAFHDAELEREDPTVQGVVVKSFTLKSP